jgi:hypothetical protein
METRSYVLDMQRINLTKITNSMILKNMCLQLELSSLCWTWGNTLAGSGEFTGGGWYDGGPMWDEYPDAAEVRVHARVCSLVCNAFEAYHAQKYRD